MIMAPSELSPALRIAGTSVMAISGLSISGGSQRVSIEGSADVTITESQLGPGAGAGISSAGTAEVTLDRVRVAGNAGGGADLAGTGGYSIRASVFSGNGSTVAAQTFGGIRIAATTAASRITNVTVAANTSATGQTAGVRCDVANVPIANAIIWGNRAGTAASGVNANCVVRYSDVEPAAAGQGNVSVNPGWVTPTYHLSGTSPLINAGDPATTAATDYDGRNVPNGTAADIGAYEIHPGSPFPFGRDTNAIALNEQYPVGRYLGVHPMGLYRDWNYVMPQAHRTAGLARANAIATRTITGTPDPNGRVVFLMIGGTEVNEMLCTESANNPPPRAGNLPGCNPQGLLPHINAAVTEGIDRDHMTPVNGAYPDQFARHFTQDDDPFPPIPANANIPTRLGNYDRIRDNVLATYTTTPVGEPQVQAMWIELANDGPVASLPDRHADAVQLMVRLGNVLRLARARYPNLQLALLSSRPYSGAPNARAPNEPYAYETGFAVKWLIDAQMAQIERGAIADTRAGDLNYTTGAAPWIAWGPYLWGHSTGSQAVGIRWFDGDFDSAAATSFFSPRGEAKAELILARDFALSPFIKCWYMVEGVCE
jgi:hypothetical protein